MQHFLIVRLGAVGDVVMASSLARRIRDERKDARITWLCGNGVAPLVRQFADVDDVITLDDRRLLLGGAAARVGVLLPLWTELAKRRFTHVMLLHVDPRYRLVVAPLVRAKLTTQTGRDAYGAMNPVTGPYFGDEYARLLDGLEHRGPIVGHFPLARLRPLSPLAAPPVPGVPRVALVPGGARNLMRESGVRRWPVEHYAAV
ncbi:MAG: hypothetical protein ABI205_07840, partial [Gemmatimonadaceae bacterium]